MTSLALAKLTASLLADDGIRKKVGWAVAFILSPLAVVVIVLCGLLSATSQHNQATVETTFFGYTLGTTVPLEFQSHVKKMQAAFASIDSQVATINAMVVGSVGLDANHIKAVFYTLYFEAEYPNAVDINGFVDCFVRYETRTSTWTDGDGEKHSDTYTVAIPLSIEDSYANLPMVITQAQTEAVTQVYEQITSGGDTYHGDFFRGDGSSTVIDTSNFMDPTIKNNLDLVDYVTQAYDNGWGYVWGTFGQVLTENLLQSKVVQYPENVGGYQTFITQTWMGGRVTDCVGLIKGYAWLDASTGNVGYDTTVMPDVGANGLYVLAMDKGAISTMEDIPGLAVWKNGHIGVYVGDGYVIEAMGTHYGVVKTKLDDRNWTAWLQIPYIQYELEGE